MSNRDETRARIAQVAPQMVGRFYANHKGGSYVVQGLTRHTETEEVLVLYRSLKYGTLDARPLAVWQQRVAGWQPRFREITEAEAYATAGVARPGRTARLWYGFLHNCLAHPLLFFAGGRAFARLFHGWTARRAWGPVALLLAAFLLLQGCGAVHRLTDPERRMRRLAERHPEAVAAVFPRDTIHIPRDTTVYLPGAVDTVEITTTLFDTLRPGAPAVVLLRDTVAGLMARVWKDEANRLRLELSKAPDSVRVEWRERVVTRTLTVTVESVPQWAKTALWAGGILLAVAMLVALFLARRRREHPP